MGIDNLASNTKSGSPPLTVSDCKPSNSGEREPGKWMSYNGLAFNPKPNSQSGILFFGFKGFAFNQKADYPAISVIAWPRKIFVDLAGVKRRNALIPLSESLVRRVLESRVNALQCLDDFLRVIERNYMRELEAKVVELQGKLDSEIVGNRLVLRYFGISALSPTPERWLAELREALLGGVQVVPRPEGGLEDRWMEACRQSVARGERQRAILRQAEREGRPYEMYVS